MYVGIILFKFIPIFQVEKRTKFVPHPHIWVDNIEIIDL